MSSGSGALRDLAVYIRKLNANSPEVQNIQSARQLLQWLRQRAIAAIAEDDELRVNTAQYRTGGSDTPPNPCLVYRRNAEPDPDDYLFALPSGLMATMVVEALNAAPPN